MDNQEANEVRIRLRIAVIEARFGESPGEAVQSAGIETGPRAGSFTGIRRLNGWFRPAMKQSTEHRVILISPNDVSSKAATVKI
ncbi:MAG: hypothetical protein RIC82_03730 [Parvibaculum sp.]